MLRKIFGFKKHNKLSLNPPQSRASTSGPIQRRPRALKIIHVGGLAEYYYMAIPAARIIEKYPSFILTRPEIFQRPWDSIVRPEEMLIPGQKYYVVPRQTVNKLRRRIRRTSSGTYPGSSLESKSFVEKDGASTSVSTSGILVKPGPKIKTRNLRVSFCDIESAKPKCGSGSVSVPSDEKKERKATKGSKEKDEKKRKARNDYSWEPSLNAINE